MNPDKCLVTLSSAELEYLQRADFLAPHLAETIDAARSVSPDKHTILVARDVADQFRFVLTDRLARSGFDVDYEPTPEGRMLEDLIDRFFIG